MQKWLHWKIATQHTFPRMCKHLQYLAFLFKSGCLHKCWHKPKIWIETWNTNIWLLIQTVYKIIHCITWHDITLPCIALHYKTWDCIALQTHCLIFNLCSSVLHVMYLCVYTFIYIYICINIYIYICIYVYIRQMPGLCPEPQPRQATHHQHHHHQTLIEDLQWK